MNSDSYYEIGSTHKICQDYAVASAKDGFGYVAVCDGCSMSGEQFSIDTGARLMALSFRNTLLKQRPFEKDLWERTTYPENLDIIPSIKQTANFFNIPTRMFDATLVAAICHDNLLKVIAIGDGGFFIKRKNSNIVQFITVEFESGAPFYPSYLMNGYKERDIYINEFGNKKVTVKSCWIDVVKRIVVAESSYSHLAKDWDFEKNKMWIYELGNIECIAVFSDGIHSFMKEGASIPFVEVACEFSSFKNYNGKFLDRRLANGLAKKCRQENIHHFDDISCAAIHFD